ncbi:DUF5335 domain-containing protein [Thiohalobacter sp.]|uniref:DUF5335 domain-containing protein n=1 Tax=Thiohalobacter sp. TaxID=2025948 RepID=UPI0026236F85|nr:DUF5335 domain-containing protein [Thiohalobacter sp.]
MATRKIDKAELDQYFDGVSKALGAVTAEVEVAGLDIGEQVEAEWLPLAGMTYDRKDDVFEIDLGDAVDHLVLHPTEVYVEESAEGLHSIEVVDRDGHCHIVKLRKALALPAPA